MNAHLDAKISMYSWIRERHLDLPFKPQFDVAISELIRLDNFRAPKDKMVCINSDVQTILGNTLQIVVDLITKTSAEGKMQAGNDQILPSLVLLIIKARPVCLISHIRYIIRFRNEVELGKGINQ
jgi:hypothetical protein